MKLIRPKGILTQGFGENANPSYKAGGLIAHSGEDYVIEHKGVMNAAVTGEVYSIINAYNPDYNKYRAVFQIVDDGDYSYEVSYGHIDQALVKEGEIAKVGEPIATQGNYGMCFVSGKLVTPEEKPSGKGSHLHFQVRKCKKVPRRKKGKTYIRNSEGYLFRDGYYEVDNYENGYNGCVSPTLFYTDLFTKNMSLGDRGGDIERLQKFLKLYGTFTYPDVTGYYGEETRKAVYAFQVAEKVASPLFLKLNNGKYCHESTRKRLNELLTK